MPRSPGTRWAASLGGLIFGYGMALAGNCGFGALSRLAGGDLRSLLIVIVMGISAYMALNGPLAHLRIALFPTAAADPGAPAGYAELVSGATGLPGWLVAAGIAGALLAWALGHPEFRRSTRHVFWAAIVGFAILSGWIGMSWLSEQGFDALIPVSHSFTAPLGETLLYLMTSSGGGLSFAIGSVGGVLAGGVLGAVWQRQFRWEACDDPRELGRQIAGGALMGIGGVLALGCSVGQGLTAFSTLSFSAPVVLGAIALGAAIGLRQLIQAGTRPDRATGGGLWDPSRFAPPGLPRAQPAASAKTALAIFSA